MFFKRNSGEDISVKTLHQKIEAGEKFVLLDVRQPDELNISSLKGATLIPMNDLPHSMEKLDPGTEIVIICRTGARSKYAQQFLMKNGFTNVKNVAGGINAWAREIDPSMPQY